MLAPIGITLIKQMLKIILQPLLLCLANSLPLLPLHKLLLLFLGF